MSLFAKAMDVINSCQTEAQLRVAEKYLRLVYPKVSYATSKTLYDGFVKRWDGIGDKSCRFRPPSSKYASPF